MAYKYTVRNNPELYEINTAAWLFDLSQRAGKPVRLGEVPSEEWDRIKAWGMDFVWLMGVWNRSQAGRNLNLNSPELRAYYETALPSCSDEDIIGSCYSISAYELDPLIGTLEDLEQARNELHQRGIGLILDFIPNHTGLDHHWIYDHPEYYIQVSEEEYRKHPEDYFPVNIKGSTLYIAHGRDPNFPPWTDTAQLNYFNPETRSALIQQLEKVARYCDGIRCDMAMLVINDIFQQTWGWTAGNKALEEPEQEFWSQVTRQIPDLVYIAEAYWDTEWKLQQMGFDFVYDKRLYDRLRSARPREVYEHLTADIEYQKRLVRFIENHDELRSLTVFGEDKVKAAAVLFSTLPGMKLYFQGQMEGKRIKLPVQIRRSKPDPLNPEILAFYNKLLAVVNEDIFHHGAWRLKKALQAGDETSENLIACTWMLDDSLRLVITNLSPQPAQSCFVFQDEINELRDYLFQDMLNGESFTVNGALLVSAGLTMKLGGYQAQIWRICHTG
jgi:hypothetical protein